MTTPSHEEPGHEEAVLSGQVWDDFCDHLKRAGQQVLRENGPHDGFNRAEGWRYLSRLTRISLDMFLESGDKDFPSFFKPSHETAKIGADSPDNLYLRAEINGNHAYRITGTRGTVNFIHMSSIEGGYEDDDAKMRPLACLDTSGSLQAADDGSLEIFLSATPKPGNWLEISPNTNAVLVRQTFLDRANERAADLKIERLDAGDATPQPLSAERLCNGLAGAASFVENTAALFADWAESFYPHTNQLPPADQAYCQKIGGDPNIIYYHSYFDLQDDEVLVLDFEKMPSCTAWNIQVNNHWMESLDYRYHRVHLNKHSVQLRRDGSFSVFIGAKNPGQENWLETAGHKKGTLCMRWTEVAEPIHPQARVEKLANVLSSL